MWFAEGQPSPSVARGHPFGPLILVGSPIERTAHDRDRWLYRREGPSYLFSFLNGVTHEVFSSALPVLPLFSS